MKKTLLATATLSLLLTSGAAFAQSNQATGTINFTGKVTTASCTLETVKDVALGEVSTRSLATAGKASKWEESVIQFKDCNLGLEKDAEGTIKAVHLTVEGGAAAPGNADLWRNNSSADNNVGVEVQIGGVKVTPAGIAEGNELLQASVENTRDPSYQVRGRMVSTGEAKEGEVSSTVTFVALYK